MTPFDRREFLKRLGVAGAGAIVAPLVPEAPPVESAEEVVEVPKPKISSGGTVMPRRIMVTGMMYWIDDNTPIDGNPIE